MAEVSGLCGTLSFAPFGSSRPSQHMKNIFLEVKIWRHDSEYQRFCMTSGRTLFFHVVFLLIQIFTALLPFGLAWESLPTVFPPERLLIVWNGRMVQATTRPTEYFHTRAWFQAIFPPQIASFFPTGTWRPSHASRRRRFFAKLTFTATVLTETN